MGFLFFTLLLLPAMLLYVLVTALLAPFMPVLQPFLDWLNTPGVFYRISQLIIAVNLLLFVVLLVVRFKWKRAGKLEWGYIHSVQGWPRLWRKLVRLVLSWGPLWVLAWAAAFCVSILAGFIPPPP
ncbi:MAG: hypothetical protein K2M15_00870 [Oscillospiraceae bacterium]|nr:hypothetical protein [Oscillospiraceae bacterium]MDE7171886.1 hypothetical protein [Oscillospiraceae bacterium]